MTDSTIAFLDHLSSLASEIDTDFLREAIALLTQLQGSYFYSFLERHGRAEKALLVVIWATGSQYSQGRLPGAGAGPRRDQPQ